MGRKFLRIIIWSLGMLLFISILIALLGNYTNPRREIYFRYHNKANIGYLLGYLPNNYFEEYHEEIVNENKFYRLVNITYLQHPSDNHNYVLFIEKNNPRNEEILFDSDSLYWYISGTTDLLSSQVNLRVFNKYLKYNNIKSKDAVIEKLCVLFGDFRDEKYKVVTNTFQITKLLKLDETIEQNAGYCYELLPDKFTPNFDKYTYLWFKDLGFFEMSLIMKENKLKMITDRYIFGPLSLSATDPQPCDSLQLYGQKIRYSLGN